MQMDVRPFHIRKFYTNKQIKYFHFLCCDRKKLRSVIRMARRHHDTWSKG